MRLSGGRETEALAVHEVREREPSRFRVLQSLRGEAGLSLPLRVEHRCSQCGAPALLEDTDRLFQCGFCRVKLCLLPGDGFRYLLPPNITGADILYFPYW